MPTQAPQPAADAAAIAALRQRALMLHQQGDLAAAEALYRTILSARPDDSEALHLCGVAAMQAGRHGAAIGLIGQAIALRPAAPYYANLGAALRRAGQGPQAVAALQEAVRLDPALAEAHANLGSALCTLGAAADALAACDAAIRLRSELPEAHLNRGVALTALGRHQDAEAACRRAAELRPGWPEAHFQHGNALLAIGQTAAAIAALRQAVALQPDHAAALTNLGSALGMAGALEDAAAALQRAVAAAPGEVAAWLNLGGVLRGLGRLDEACATQQRILAARSEYWPAWSNLAAIRHDQGRPAEADLAWQRSLALHPDQPDAQYGRALTLLLGGDFARGWAQLEWRWQAGQHRARRRHAALPLWAGGPLAGRTILLHAEEGLGDAIQFARYVPLVAARDGQVVLETYAPLARLFRGLDGVTRMAVQGEALPPCVLQCPLQSLPLAFGTRLETIPAAVPYLRVDGAVARAWAARLAGYARPRVGVVWGGSPTHGKDRERSIAFARLAPLWRVPGVRWFSLQLGARAAELAAAPAAACVVDLAADLTDLADTAGALCQLDLVVSVDTAVAHLAGALGRPVWLLLAASPDWRWMLRREDSPWYPSMRLFRQARAGDWDSVIGRVAQALSGAGWKRAPG
jgi:tetratricopeptide (TPR) repeat protein